MIKMSKLTGFVMSALLLGGVFLMGCGSDATPTATLAAPTAAVSESAPPVVEPTAVIVEETATVSEPIPTEVPTEETVQDFTDVGPDGATDIGTTAVATAISQAAPGQLSESEAAGILFMREEEKLASDVYLTLYEKWGLAVFSNIASSEQTHTDTVLTLIERYGLEDPAAGKAVGEFTNSDLQALYDQLVAQGSQSLADALKVGAAIEEIDILDLQEHIAQTAQADIQLVYENLMQGSTNHLRAFVSALERQGESYAPQYLDPDAYDEILSGEGSGQRGKP